MSLPWPAAFAAGTVLALAYSWRSLHHAASHGVPRFFAFECILILGLLNWRAWFSRPASPLHIVSWLLLLASIVLALHGYRLLRRLGRPTAPPPGSPLHGFEHTSELVVVGAYRLIRHPLYASLLYLAWGAALKSATAASLGVAALAGVFLWETGRREERENVERFGEPYRRYMRRTRRFVPFVW